MNPIEGAKRVERGPEASRVLQTYTKSFSTFLERFLSAFQDIANSLSSFRIFQAARRVSYGWQEARRVSANGRDA